MTHKNDCVRLGISTSYAVFTTSSKFMLQTSLPKYFSLSLFFFNHNFSNELFSILQEMTVSPQPQSTVKCRPFNNNNNNKIKRPSGRGCQHRPSISGWFLREPQPQGVRPHTYYLLNNNSNNNNNNNNRMEETSLKS